MFFKNLKWQLLASSIAAVILIVCLIVCLAHELIAPAIIIAVIIGAYIISVNVWFHHFVSQPIKALSENAKTLPTEATAHRCHRSAITRSEGSLTI